MQLYPGEEIHLEAVTDVQPLLSLVLQSTHEPPPPPQYGVEEKRVQSVSTVQALHVYSVELATIVVARQ